MAVGTPLMPSHQYHFVLLSERPDTYNFLNLTDCFNLRSKTGMIDRASAKFYVLVPSLFGEPIPLPRHALNWTTIAYLLWDDMDPAKLSREHQDALLDWLHFGGQLILSGPDCLEKLENSFLADFLPARYDEGYNLTAEDLGELNTHWAVKVPPNRSQIKPRVFEVAGDSLRAVRFNPHRESEYIKGTGELAIERQVGRGRIVVTAFPLNAPAVRAWPSFPSFLNSALLRRPARKFLQREGEIDFHWEDFGSIKNDPLIGSTLRFVSRDLSSSGTAPSATVDSEFYDMDDEFDQWANMHQRSTSVSKARNLEFDHRFFGGYQDTAMSGVAGWNDSSAVANAARSTLVEAAGIIPPSSSFVLKMLAGYLLVLVPLNWLVFRIMGRVEWAWIAAPFIAIIGAVAVIKAAALDIGFVRSNTQIGLLEAWGDYPRAHVTEYSALYTSLSTGYSVQLDNASGQALPFASSLDSDVSASSPARPITLRKSVTNQLEGLQIQSNSTGLLHTEFMLDLEGSWYASFDDQQNPTQVTNGTYLNIENVGVLWRSPTDEYHFAWIGDLSVGQVSDLQWQPTSPDQLYQKWKSLTLFSSSDQVASEIWNEHFGQEQQSATIEELSAIDALSEKWSQLKPILQRTAFNNNITGQITKQQFVNSFSLLPSQEDLQVGRLLDALKNLQLGLGEVRLIGVTGEKLGRTKMIPDSTRINQQAMVLVHLKRPPLPQAVPDVNTFTDFTEKSDLDFKRIDEELDQMGFGN